MTIGLETNLRALAARGALVIGLSQIYRTALGFIANLFLVRMLKPADFGLIAMVSTCVGFVTLLQDLGLVSATIQRERISPAQVSALFWLAVAAGTILAAGLAVTAPAIAWFYHEPRLTNLTFAFAAVVFISGWQSQPFAMLNRELRFQILAVIDVLAATIGISAGVAVAWWTASYWALFAAPATSAIVSLVCIFLVCGFWPSRPSFEGQFKEIFKFGSGLSGFNLVNYFARNADNVLIGKFYGGVQLGFYDRAYRLLLFPLSQVTWPLGRLMVPLLSRTQSDPVRYRKMYVDSISLIMLVTQPAIIFATIFSEDVFRIILGPSWLPAVPIFRWLGLCAVQQVVAPTFGWIYISQGRGGDYFKIGTYNAVITVASFLVGLPWGPVGVAAAYTIVNYVIVVPLTLWNLGLRGPIASKDILKAAFPHVIALVFCSATLIVLPITQLSLGMCIILTIYSYLAYGLILVTFHTKRLLLLESVRTFGKIFPFSGRH